MITELVNGFDDEIFSRFLNAKFSGSFSKVGKTLSPKNESQWSEVCQLGIVKTLRGTNNSNMPLLVVSAKLPDGETLKERSSRIKQFKFAKQVLDEAMSNPAPGVDGVLTQGLFVFHDEAGNFRLSLVYGKAEGTKLVWSTAKRLSFHVQAGDGNKTFRDRMALDWSSFDKLKEAFSVEKLTKEFYNRLFDWYQWALSDEMNVTYPNNTETDDDDREINEHIIRLITRLMFVWFLKQKHLVPDHLFDPDELKKILKDFDPLKGDNYYRAILQNLFFATLNSEIPERAFAVDAGNIRENKEHFDIKTLYRYGGEFLLPQDAVLKLFEKIPFLNGGLFECLDRGKNYSDGFSRDKTKQARLPNRLFFDSEKGLIPLLSQYHFTVEENSPGDEEVALDPELLGKVFENLLGAYNPETKVAARNATGSFYTPREIVNYMVDESLIAYLQGKLEPRMNANERESQKSEIGNQQSAIESKLRLLFSRTEGNPFNAEETAILDKALISAKILDPACGSGAFPMGILLRMVELLRILRNLPEDASVYDLKLELIENCIYGGDIQCIAVQISKLRFFISLVCEQKPSASAKDNYGIHTLPNLETKFVSADSLIGLPKGGNELPMQNVEAMKKELWAVRHKHFLARTYQEKKDLRKEDKILREKLAKALEQGGGFDTASAKLMAAWDPYDQNTSAPFSDPEWMFNVRDGFDVVIGNPPYKILTKNNTDASYLEAVVKGYGTIKSSNSKNLFVPFIELGVKKLVRATAVLSYIVPEGLFKTRSYEACKTLMSESGSVQKILTFTDYVFENAVTGNLIFLYRHGVSVATEKLHFDSQYCLHPAVEKDGGLLSKIGGDASPLESYAMLFKGMVVQDRESVLADTRGSKSPDIFLLGKNIAKWTITSKKYTSYDNLVIIGGTKRKEKHDRFPRILIRRTGDTLCCAFLEEAALTESTLYSCWSTTQKMTDKFLLALLNSRLMNFYNKNMFITNQQGFPQVLMNDLKLLPIRLATNQRPYIDLVDKILAEKKADPKADTSALEERIDELVYDLYGLTPEEKEIVKASGAQKSEVGSQRAEDSEEETEDGGRKTEVRERTTEVSGRKSEVSESPVKKAVRKRKPQLPPSLPGWD